MIVTILKTIYVAIAVAFSTLLAKDVAKVNLKKEKGSVGISAMIGAISYFFDTLGIGSFATSTAMLRFFKQVPDKTLPGTLNVACTLPSLLEAFIFISIVQVDYMTLICMVVATSIGGWLGAGFVSKLPEQKIRLAMSIALFITATFMFAKQLNLIPLEFAGAIGFTGIKLIIAIIFSAIIGVLTAIGIGTFAPFLALSLLLGMSARSVFPIMMSATALGCGVAGMKFIRAGAYERKVTLAMTIPALVGVVIAAYLVKTLPLNILTWVVVGVIYYTSISLMLGYVSARRKVQVGRFH
jgi:uncharacterized membrane protein YfcA